MDKPEIDFPDFDPPADLVVTDLTEGEGAEATAGSTGLLHERVTGSVRPLG
jgi:peptidylprolyl isomerase